MFQDGYIVLNCVGVYEPHPLPEPALNERKYGAILECRHARVHVYRDGGRGTIWER